MFIDDNYLRLSGKEPEERSAKIKVKLGAYKDWCHKSILLLNVGRISKFCRVTSSLNFSVC